MFIEQAYKGNNQWWRVTITTTICTFIFILNAIVFFLMTEQQQQQAYELVKAVPKNIGLIVNLLPFAFLLGVLFLLVYLLHRRSILTLTTARPRLDFGRFFFSFLLMVGLTLGSFALSYALDPTHIVWNFDPLKFVTVAVICLVLLPLQIGFEEYLFRGYLMQQIGIAAGNRWFALLVTSVVFGLFHSANPEVAHLGFGVMAFYIGTGLLLGVMTLMDDGLELALGFHLANNLMAALLITTDYSALQTDAMFRYTGQENPESMLVEMLVTMAVSYPLILLIFAKKYRWRGWKEKLTGKVFKPKPIADVITNPNL